MVRDIPGRVQFLQFNAELLKVPFAEIEAGIDFRIDAGLDEVTEAFSEPEITKTERKRAILNLGLAYSTGHEYRNPEPESPFGIPLWIPALRQDMEEYIARIPNHRHVLRRTVFYSPDIHLLRFLNARVRSTIPRGDYGMQAFTAGVAIGKIIPDYRK